MEWINKTLLLIIAALVMAHTTEAQQKRISESKVPQFVQRALKAKFSNAKVKKWKKEDDMYIAQIIQQAPKASESKKMEAAFYADGKWLRTIAMTTWEQIPETVKIAFKKSNYNSWTIQKTTQNNYFDGTTIYSFEVDNGNQFNALDQNAFKEIREIYICSSGKIMKSIKKIETLEDCM